RNTFGRDFELPFDFERRESRRYDDLVRAVRMVARQCRIVPPHLGLGVLWMRQEMKIVNRDDTGRRPRRKQQRMRRMCHIELRARGRWGGRPREPVPREVQQADWHAPVDATRAVDVGLVIEAILPRARKQRELEWLVGIRWKRREQRSRELVSVF